MSTTGKNVRWSMPLGSETYGNPVIANGKVYVGTNNGAGYISRYPSDVDFGCAAVLRRRRRQHSCGSTRAKNCRPVAFMIGRTKASVALHWSMAIDLWYVTSRGEVVCLDTEGFTDGENDGPVTDEPNENKDEADVVWRFNMMNKLAVSQHNMCSCSVTCCRKPAVREYVQWRG